MKKYFEVLRKCSLFNEIEDENIEKILTCFGAKIETYQKDEIIFFEGEPARCLGIVLSGATQIVRIDFYGNRSIVATVIPSQMFGESFACIAAEALPIDVVASTDAKVLLIEAGRITRPCPKACGFHNQIIFNLLKIVATKNVVFNQKIEVTSKRSTREKLMTYLLLQAKAANSNSFTIPFDRQELADYLEVDRSGLSVEISKLRREGIIECRKSEFTLL